MIKISTDSVISKSFYECPTVRISDHFRPLTVHETSFIENLQRNEHELLKGKLVLVYFLPFFLFEFLLLKNFK